MIKMKNKIIICVIFAFNMFQCFDNIKAQLPSSDPAYQIVWEDNFNGNQLDGTKWAKRYPWGQPSNFQTFNCTSPPILNVPMAALNVSSNDTSNCRVNNGILKLTTRKVNNFVGEGWSWPSCNPPSYSLCNGYGYCDNPTNNTCWHKVNLDFKFTTAMLYSTYKFRYGYFEMRFKLPSLPSPSKTYEGHGGTFWFWESDSIADWSEIDVFEINAYNPDNSTYYNAGPATHYRENQGGTAYEDWTSYTNFSPNTWYTIGVNWTSKVIEFYINGVKQYTSYNHPDLLRPMPIIINLGGNYTPVDNYCVPFDTLSMNGTYFPYSMEIDYVKVWQLNKDCDTDLTISSYNPATYPNKIHKSITMGTNISITNQNFQSFWASDYIYMNGETYMGNQSNVLFNVVNCINIGIDTIYSKSASNSFIKPMPKAFLDKMNHKH